MSGKPTVFNAVKTKGNFEVLGAISNRSLDAALSAGLKFKKLGTVTKDDASGAGKSLGTLPKSSYVTQMICVVDTAFNSGSGDTIVIGTAADEDVLMAAGDSSPGSIGGYAKVVAFATGETDLTVRSKRTGAGEAASAGSATIYAVYFGE